MSYNPEIHHRRSIRLKGYDYSSTGAYFVTICVHQRECLFGEVCDGGMLVNPCGSVVESIWGGLSERFSGIILDAHVIMPNHFHGIIIIDGVGAPLAAPEKYSESCKGAASGAPTVGSIVRVFKSLSAIAVNRLLDRSERPLWQRNYHERIIRNDAELNAARKYIGENPLKWDMDTENPANLAVP